MVRSFFQFTSMLGQYDVSKAAYSAYKKWRHTIWSMTVLYTFYIWSITIVWRHFYRQYKLLHRMYKHKEWSSCALRYRLAIFFICLYVLLYKHLYMWFPLYDNYTSYNCLHFNKLYFIVHLPSKAKLWILLIDAISPPPPPKLADCHVLRNQT